MEKIPAQTVRSSGDQQVAPDVEVKEEDMKEEHVDVETPDSTSMEVGGEEKPLDVGPHDEESGPALCSVPNRPPVAVECLLSQPFSQRSSVEKMDIIARGRPTPDIDLPDFESNLYISKPWLTACPKANKLFCWSCLLFSAKSSIWTTGFGDLENVQRDALEHERSVQHISSQVQLCNVKPKSDTEDSESESSEPEQNPPVEELQNAEEVRMYVLKLLASAVVLLGGMGQCLEEPIEEEQRGSDTKPSSGLIGLVNLCVKYCDKLVPHIDAKRTVSNITIQHQNNLVESVGELLLEEIKAELKDASFVSLILNATHIDGWKLATILRYVTKDGLALERFVGFVPENMKIHTAEGLTEWVLTFMEKMDGGDKMVALSYGGQDVTSNHISGHVAQVKERYPWVNFVNWYGSETNAALAEAWGGGLFFGSLHTLGDFFTASYRSGGRVRALKEIISKRGLSSSAPLKWKKKSDLVETVKEHRESLIELGRDIDEHPEEWDGSTMFCSWMFKDLEDPKFLFLLEVFSTVFRRSDMFVKGLQILKTGSGAKALKRTLEVLKAMHGDFDAIFSKGLKQEDNPTQACKWAEESRDAFRELYADLLDAVTSELAMRFESLAKMTFTELLNVSRFPVYKGAFPEEAFNCLKDGYGRFFDLALLRNELEVIYSSPELKKKHFFELVTSLHTTGLTAILPQVSKLCELIQVLPLSSTKKERGLSAVSSRIEAYGEQATGAGTWEGQRMKGSVPAVALMAVESKLLCRISKSEGFEERVARLFDQREPRLDLVFI